MPNTHQSGSQATEIAYVQRVGASEELRDLNRQRGLEMNRDILTSHQEREELEQYGYAARPSPQTPMERFLTLEHAENPDYVYGRQITASTHELRCVNQSNVRALEIRQRAAETLLKEMEEKRSPQGTTERCFEDISDGAWNDLRVQISEQKRTSN